MFKRLLIVALACVALAGAKSYSFTVVSPTQAGAAKLKPGEYNLTVKGSQAVITDDSGRKTEAAVKVEPADSKFPTTSVITSNTSGTDKIEWIGLKGSTDKVVFQ